MRLWKQAVRQLLRTPGFVVVATLALVLGIGSTTAIFTVVRAVFLRGLPYADADSLVRLGSSVPDQEITGAGFSYPRFEAVAVCGRRSADSANRKAEGGAAPHRERPLLRPHRGQVHAGS